MVFINRRDVKLEELLLFVQNITTKVELKDLLEKSHGWKGCTGPEFGSNDDEQRGSGDK